MKLERLLDGVDIISMGADVATEVGGVYSDSRKVKPGGIFVAISGFKEDGGLYIEASRKNGAAVIVGEKADGSADVVVKDSRRELSRIAANFYGRPSEKMKIIGVTGTNGKTTVTNLLKHIIEKCLGVSCGLIGTNEIIIGEKRTESTRTTPESLEIQRILAEMCDAGIEYAVMEVSSHALKLGRVADVRFEVGVFTNLTPEHLDFHGTLDDYLESKALLFKMCEKGVINADDRAAAQILETVGCKTLTYAINRQDADILAKNVRLSPEKVEFEALGHGVIERAELGIPGEFSVYNALAAIGAGLMLEIPLTDIITALATAKGVKGRAEVVPVSADFSVVIDYAHTPDALENILKTLKRAARGKLICLFGCGGDRDREKRPVMGRIARELADFSVITSDNPRTEEAEAIIEEILKGLKDRKNCKVIPDRREAIAYALDIAEAGDIVLLAGKGHETYQEINGIKHHMDERKIVADFEKTLTERAE